MPDLRLKPQLVRLFESVAAIMELDDGEQRLELVFVDGYLRRWQTHSQRNERSRPLRRFRRAPARSDGDLGSVDLSRHHDKRSLLDYEPVVTVSPTRERSRPFEALAAAEGLKVNEWLLKLARAAALSSKKKPGRGGASPLLPTRRPKTSECFTA